MEDRHGYVDDEPTVAIFLKMEGDVHKDLHSLNFHFEAASAWRDNL